MDILSIDIIDGRILSAMMDRDAEDRDAPSTVPVEYAGLAWPEIVEVCNEYESETRLYWENERALLSEARRMEWEN